MVRDQQQILLIELKRVRVLLQSLPHAVEELQKDRRSLVGRARHTVARRKHVTECEPLLFNQRRETAQRAIESETDRDREAREKERDMALKSERNAN
jgi:hypothetical protein